MGLGEFNLIERYFSHQVVQRADVATPIGDDAAVVSLAAGEELVVSVDTLIADVHFPAQTSARAIGHKALAVNLSDLAAMGAEPAWATLALTLPHADADWLAAFSGGFFDLAEQHQVALIGGDTCCGPLAITVQIMGTVARGQALKRSGAVSGDLIYVTGQIGDAGLGLRRVQAGGAAKDDYFVQRLNYPSPQVGAGRALVGLASAAIDISDGLAADLGHILDQSGVGAELDVATLPVADEVRQAAEPWWQWPLGAGDDYELCFTVPAERRVEVEARLNETGCVATCIGLITTQPGLRLRLETRQLIEMNHRGYRHFV